jgi:tRNA(Ser,Leu) C12 N-acetylase TAN1
MSNPDGERGFDGLTSQEAIARRTFLALDKITNDFKDESVSFETAIKIVRVLIETNMPFLDRKSKEIVSQIMRMWDVEAEERASLDVELTKMKHPTFGAWR